MALLPVWEPREGGAWPWPVTPRRGRGSGSCGPPCPSSWTSTLSQATAGLGDSVATWETAWTAFRKCVESYQRCRLCGPAVASRLSLPQRPGLFEPHLGAPGLLWSRWPSPGTPPMSSCSRGSQGPQLRSNAQPPPTTAHSEHVSRSGWQEGTVPGRPSAGGLKDTSRIPSAGQDLVERLALATLNGVAGCRPLTLSINP